MKGNITSCKKVKMNQTVETTSSSFAIALLFYYHYQRGKLTEEDLIKIHKKYHKKPSELLQDLQKKYKGITIPSNVTLYELSRILSMFMVPTVYKDAIYRDVDRHKMPEYSSRLDACSTDLDANLLFPPESSSSEPHRLFASDPFMSPKDNMSSVLRLLPTSYVTNGMVDTYVRHTDAYLTINPTAEKKHLDIPTTKEDSTSEDNRHVLRVLADIASYDEKALNNSSSSSAGPNEDRSKTTAIQSAHTPLYQLKVYMENHVKIRVVIRRRKGIRGYVEGYVCAMDKHWNILMRDADEVYVPNQNRTGALKAGGEFKSDRGVLRRHLPQLLLRGDNIVLICSLFPTASIPPGV